jgi:MIP family channel proteins
MDKPTLVQRAIVELLGTFGFFFLGYMGIAAAVSISGSIGSGGIAAGFGLGLMLMIFAFGHVSGGHFNPAVSLGLAFGGQFPWGEVPVYWVAQLVGGIGAAALVRGMFTSQVGDAMVNAPGQGISNSTAFVLEIITTLLFVVVIHAVATDKRAPWQGILAPVAIGTFIFTALTVVGPISGGSYNPARAIAPALVSGNWTDIWIYIFGPLIGGAAAGVLYGLLRRWQRVPEVEGMADPDRGKAPA